MSTIDDPELTDKLTEEVCSELPYNPPVHEVRGKISEYIRLGLNENQVKQITIDVFSIRKEILEELEFGDEEVIAYDLPNYNRLDWR